ncbi:MAG: polysaccharide deacetylase family protein [Catalinimonas sp.]
MRTYPHSIPRWVPAVWSQRLWHVPTERREVFLTFDDGPVPGATEFVLDALARARARATFFCVGENVAKHPELFRRLLSEGHGVGNHTQYHLNGRRTPLHAYLADVARCDATMQQVGGAHVRLFRPPYGRLTAAQSRALRQLDYRVVMWSVLAGDFDAQLPAERCLRRTWHRVAPGAVVTLHDSTKALPTVQYVLPRLLDRLAAGSYTCAVLPGA